MNVLVIGSGAVGSFAVNYIARLSRTQNLPLALVLADFDTVEERNVYSQDFTFEDIGKNKAEVTAKKASEYINSITAFPEKVTPENLKSLHEEYNFDCIVITVDNQFSRVVLNTAGTMGLKIPVLHSSINLNGTGQVSWSYFSSAKNCYRSSWPEDPDKLTAEQLTSLMSPEKTSSPPPCELFPFVPLIQTAAMETALSLSTFIGNDLHKEVLKVLRDKGTPEETLQNLPTSTKGFMLSRIISFNTSTLTDLFHQDA